MCFFFSSRRRHTRWTGDWSSDVCSSDLTEGYQAVLTLDGYALINDQGRVVYALSREPLNQADEPVVVTIVDAEVSARSEERRVGKEGRSGLSRILSPRTTPDNRARYKPT